MTTDGRRPEADGTRRYPHGRTRVKICGITRPPDLAAAIDAGADAVGIVCDVPVDTHREVSVSRAATLVDATPPFVTAVLVTMATDPDRVRTLAAHTDADAIQIHGDIGVGDLAYLRSRVDARLLVAVDPTDEEAATRYDDLADALVIDSVTETGAGGTGKPHDWETTRQRSADLDSPIVLAGGLSPENVATAIRTVSPFAVDVSTGVEATGGVKDHDAIAAFVARATGGRTVSETVGR